MSAVVEGFDKFVRTNPLSDKFASKGFHHVEFFAGDALSVSKRFMGSMGVELAAKSDFSTGNDVHASYLMQTGEVKMLFSAAYQTNNPATQAGNDSLPFPTFDSRMYAEFFTNHGLAVRAVAISVEDVSGAHATMTANGGISVLPPTVLQDNAGRGSAEIAEVVLYGDVVLRLVDDSKFTGSFMPCFTDVIEASRCKGSPASVGKYGIYRYDHMVGNVPKLQETLNYIRTMAGFHDFAEFTAEDVGTVDSGLNSLVLANNNEMILLPINEPTFGTKRKSQIQTYLEQNKGPGVQHLALFSEEIFSTMKLMREATAWGGFEFMAGQGGGYYERARARCGNTLSEEQYKQCEEMGILIDQDDQGTLLQIFTKPIGDRPTIFFEIIQRVGCMTAGKQKPGCGGFGKGNFKDLFKSIEVYENELKIN
mmetsp:Transcript_36416/g.74747  ORF Transcript_36416/g.74747 Transcript_36416/m.74747 type:complete len:423 (-) Transcript_36416:28-1296(-)|eukprot:CAMPEP_0181306444 /NCGR_PEP_ID=MMETSP1101-20121128/10303_1 /TAXON_ID=46948 /ORGANISM="Rhodomonas abbreviata, Strain Caron Lab Isolate" /LENGTH=422 /DNA_ID=CAMNT_0023412501 /DNA_START=78 /DNA_END=1346 /DNA_ORIENTATION=+